MFLQFLMIFITELYSINNLKMGEPSPSDAMPL